MPTGTGMAPPGRFPPEPSDAIPDAEQLLVQSIINRDGTSLVTSSTSKSRRNMAPLNLMMGLVGLACLSGVIAAGPLNAPSFVTVPLVVALIASMIFMFFTRKSDEYTLSLWSSGANAAFAVIVIWMLMGPFFEGVYDGFNSVRHGTDTEMDFPIAAGSYIAILAFYLTFNIKRLTGAI